MVCYRCKIRLKDGDSAYEQEIRSITVVGSKVKRTVKKIVVCTNCAE